MHIGRFLSAWWTDWLALMSGAASVGLLFWATISQHTEGQGKLVLLIASAICFVVGSYRIWAKENRRYEEVTGKTPMEILNDLVVEFEKLESWYANDAKTQPKKLDKAIETARQKLRKAAPKYVYQFNEAVEDPSTREHHIPLVGRTVEQLTKWYGNEPQRKSWEKASSALKSLKKIRSFVQLIDQRQS